MTISFYTLAVTGPGKKPALLEFNGKSHLVVGPTDTGKSYIVECLRYCLGSDQRPKDVGYSEGYTRIALQVARPTGEQFTFFRDLTDASELVYPGFHIYPPQDGTAPLEQAISDLLATWGGGSGKKILAKSGKLGNLTAGDLRRVSIFDEIETLDNAPFEGKDTNFKTRNRSALALILTGTDDSEMTLPPTTDERNIAKGHVEALNEQILSLLADVPEGLTKQDADEGLAKVSSEIEAINNYLQSHAAELSQLKQERARIDNGNQALVRRISALSEARSRFLLLDKKYLSDLQRLQAMGTAAAVMTSFETRPCPLCLTDIQHQARHEGQDEQAPILRQAAIAESEKIAGLREGLKAALVDVTEETHEQRALLEQGETKAQENIRLQESLLSSKFPSLQNGLAALTERKSVLAVAVNNLERADRLRIRIEEMKARAKRTKQVIARDMSQSSTLLCARVKQLLNSWGVPGVDSVYFDESVSDIEINQRKRTSYGKGKRGIFLTAYMIALMERAIGSALPHLGLAVIDSPVVTYKDPKHAASKDDDELLDEGVKDRFYAWLADRAEDGQIIILENEEPNVSTKAKLKFTEFVGRDIVEGRPGFFPV